MMSGTIEILLVISRMILHTILQQHNEILVPPPPHILRFLHFSDSMNQPDKNDNYDRLWKMRTLFEWLSGMYIKFYNPSEGFSVKLLCSPNG
jgi:hypothetical protein